MIILFVTGITIFCIGANYIPQLSLSLASQIVGFSRPLFIIPVGLIVAIPLFLFWTSIVLASGVFIADIITENTQKPIESTTLLQPKKQPPASVVILNPQGNLWKHPEIIMKSDIDETFVENTENSIIIDNKLNEGNLVEHWEVLEQDDISHEAKYLQQDDISHEAKYPS